METQDQNDDPPAGAASDCSDLLGGIEWPVGGYAPGHYSFRCGDCEEIFYEGDKRATQCLPCAIAGLIRGADRLRSERDRLHEALNPRLWTPEMSLAWHAALPDTHKAFDDLRKAAMTPNAQVKRQAERSEDRPLEPVVGLSPEQKL